MMELTNVCRLCTYTVSYQSPVHRKYQCDYRSNKYNWTQRDWWEPATLRVAIMGIAIQSVLWISSVFLYHKI